MDNTVASTEADDSSISGGANEPEMAAGSGIFRYSGFQKLFAGSLLGTLADRIYQMALIAAANVIYAGTASENKVVQIQIVATIPGLLLYSFSGSLVDSCDRRRLMMLIKASKVIAVLLFFPLLWKALHQPAEATLVWPWCLAVVVFLNIITVPFSPARAAAVPDVVPDEHRSLGASLMATTGLISLLVGSMLGGVLAGKIIGPAWSVVVASGLYVGSAIFFSRLPDSVAVPGNKRAGTQPEVAAASSDQKHGLRQYISGLIDGIVYCFSRPSLLALIFFETVFWTIGSAFYVLLLFYARTVLMLEPNDITLFFGIGLGCAGIGLFGGAIGIGKVCQRVSPIISYPPAFLLISIGLYGVFRASPVDGAAPLWTYPVLFGLGLGGGMMLGRVDADVLAIADERMRGRVFSIKAMAFATTILATMLFITEAGMLATIWPALAQALSITEEGLSDPQKREITLWMPRAMFMMFPLVFLLSWAVDVAIWSRRPETQVSRGLHAVGYWLIRAFLRFVTKVMFRLEVVGVENIPKSGPVILAANHASFIDPILLGCASPRLVQWIMYSSYYRSFAHPIFRFLRCIPVDEGGRTAALKAGMRSLKDGACIGIFPEGHVSDDGQLQPAQGGALFLAQRSGAQVVPMALKGNFKAYPRGAWFPRLSKITVIVGEPFTIGKDISREETAEKTDQLMQWLADKLELKPPPKSKPRGEE